MEKFYRKNETRSQMMFEQLNLFNYLIDFNCKNLQATVKTHKISLFNFKNRES